jgi:hypothetical protein
MARVRDSGEARGARIDVILEELRLNTEDLRELAKETVERARQTERTLRSTVARCQAQRAERKAGKGR